MPISDHRPNLPTLFVLVGTTYYLVMGCLIASSFLIVFLKSQFTITPLPVPLPVRYTVASPSVYYEMPYPRKTLFVAISVVDLVRSRNFVLDPSS